LNSSLSNFSITVHYYSGRNRKRAMLTMGIVDEILFAGKAQEKSA